MESPTEIAQSAEGGEFGIFGSKSVLKSTAARSTSSLELRSGLGVPIAAATAALASSAKSSMLSAMDTCRMRNREDGAMGGNWCMSGWKCRIYGHPG